MYIEIAPPEYQIKLPQNTVKLYCFSLNIAGNAGWRLPTQYELYKISKSIDYDCWIDNRGFWTSDGYTALHDYWSLPWLLLDEHELYTKRWVVPVRTLPEPTGLIDRLIYKWNGYNEIRNCT